MTIIKAGSQGRCPHCLTVVRFNGTGQYTVFGNKEEQIHPLGVVCPQCDQVIVILELGHRDTNTFIAENSFMVWPRSTTRPVPDEVKTESPDIATDYEEAALVLDISPKASAALSRRCLQAVLREKCQATKQNLAQQIDDAIPKLPSYIAKNIDAIRNIGNFSAHPFRWLFSVDTTKRECPQNEK